MNVQVIFIIKLLIIGEHCESLISTRYRFDEWIHMQYVVKFWGYVSHEIYKLQQSFENVIM